MIHIISESELKKMTGGLTRWGKAIRIKRLQKGSNILQMASDLGVDVSYLSSLEVGEIEDDELKNRCEEYLDKLPDDEKIKALSEIVMQKLYGSVK